MSDTKVITGKVQFSYVNVFTPRAMADGQKPKYSVCLIIPKDDAKTIKKIKKAIKVALEEGKSKFGGKIPKTYKSPLRDGDQEREDQAEFENCLFLNANAFKQPGIVDKDRQEIIDEEEIYSGCYGRASINFYAFNTNGNKGVAVGLNHIQKLADGEPLGPARSSAEDDFDDDFDDDYDDDDMLG